MDNFTTRVMLWSILSLGRLANYTVVTDILHRLYANEAELKAVLKHIYERCGK